MRLNRVWTLGLAIALAAGTVTARPREAPDAHSSPMSADATALIAELRERAAFVDSALVVQHGKRLAEYFASDSVRRHAHPLRSAGKSVIITALGIALGPGREHLIDSPVFASFHKIGWLPEAKGQRANIRFRDVFSMSAGIRCLAIGTPNNPCDPSQIASPLPWKVYLQSPMNAEPGTRFAYNDAAPTVAMALIYALSGNNAERFAAEKLFRPLECSDNARLGALTPEDMLKLGELYLAQGRYKGRQLVSAEWLAQSTRPQFRFPERPDAGYGYFWWTRRLWAGERPLDSFFAAGNGGQLILVIPDLDAVVVTTGTAYDNNQAIAKLMEWVKVVLLPHLVRHAPEDA